MCTAIRKSAAKQMLLNARAASHACLLAGVKSVVTCVAMVGMFAPAVQAQPESTVQRLSVADYRSYLPESHSVRRALQEYAAEVALRSQGRMIVDVLPGTLAGSPAQQMQKLRQGGSDVPQVMVLAATGLSDLDPPFELFDLPYAVRDDHQFESIVNGVQGKKLLQGLAQHELIGLAWMSNGFRQLSTSSATLESADDLRGLRIRTMPAAASIAAFEAWGAQPEAIAASEVRNALETGRLDAQEGFVSLMLQGRVQEVQKHLWLTHHSFGAQVLVVNQTFWRSLNDAQKAWLQQAATKVAGEQRLRVRDDDLQALNVLEQAGMKIHRLKPEVIDALADATKALRIRVHADKDAVRTDIQCEPRQVCHEPMRVSASDPVH